MHALLVTANCDGPLKGGGRGECSNAIRMIALLLGVNGHFLVLTPCSTGLLGHQGSLHTAGSPCFLTAKKVGGVHFRFHHEMGQQKGGKDDPGDRPAQGRG